MFGLPHLAASSLVGKRWSACRSEYVYWYRFRMATLTKHSTLTMAEKFSPLQGLSE